MALFESYDRREPQILAVLKNYGIGSVEECAEICKAKGLDIYKLVEGIQPICFENAKWAYTVGCAIAIKKGCKRAADAAAAIGEGLQAFCIPGWDVGIIRRLKSASSNCWGIGAAPRGR